MTAEERIQLQSAARSQSLPAALARRYRVSRPTVSLWRRRFAEDGMAGLHNAWKAGRPRNTSGDAIARLVNTALQKKPRGKTHWSHRALAAETGLSKSTVHRYLTLFGLQPHRTKSFKLSNDPPFIEKVRDIVGLYLNPHDRALVLCVDEKSLVQVLERTQPMGLGYVEGITHDYIRHPTRHHHLVRCARRRQWRSAGPVQTQTPPSESSWLNQVERWFGLITQQAICRGSFDSVAHLKREINEFVKQYNQHSKPFMWAATAESILQKIERLCKVTTGTAP